MSKKKKVVVSKSGKKVVKRPEPTQSQYSADERVQRNETTLIFQRENYLYMLGGAVLIALAMILMSGGQMPSPDVWDESIIYSARRITIAPILFVAGLVLEVVGIFK
jgi:hypothetical protein